MGVSPRSRRLANDRRVMLRLQQASPILDFETPEVRVPSLPEEYRVNFRGWGVYRRVGELEVRLRDWHQVRIRLGASYPRMMPELFWNTPIFHPNISSQGVVCLGGYSTHWAPSLQLDRLCEMLWDMIRYRNYDVESPYNREAARWARTQLQYGFPLDPRPLRPPAATTGGSIGAGAAGAEIAFAGEPAVEAQVVGDPPVLAEIVFLDESGCSGAVDGFPAEKPPFRFPGRFPAG